MRSLMANVKVTVFFAIKDRLLADYINDRGKLPRYYEYNLLRFPTAVFSNASMTEHMVTTLLTGKRGELTDDSDFFSIANHRVLTVEFEDYPCFKKEEPDTVLYVCNKCGHGIKKKHRKFIIR